ncbi:uncharacterized protein [Eucyclogobius newberryi]|uniref:uncharacterized protein n=1 Tax=Eucyclogobius newberryi TaxID=166745 RepID=UPI003B5C1A45
MAAAFCPFDLFKTTMFLKARGGTLRGSNAITRSRVTSERVFRRQPRARGLLFTSPRNEPQKEERAEKRKEQRRGKSREEGEKRKEQRRGKRREEGEKRKEQRRGKRREERRGKSREEEREEKRKEQRRGREEERAEKRKEKRRGKSREEGEKRKEQRRGKSREEERAEKRERRGKSREEEREEKREEKRKEQRRGKRREEERAEKRERRGKSREEEREEKRERRGKSREEERAEKRKEQRGKSREEERKEKKRGGKSKSKAEQRGAHVDVERGVCAFGVVVRSKTMTSALQFGSLFAHFPLGFRASDGSSSKDVKREETETPAEFIQRLRRVTGLKKEDVFCDLRVPEQLQHAKDDISVVLLTGHGIFCIDVKTWRGTLSVQNANWQIQVKEEESSFTNTRIEQTEDALRVVTEKTRALCAHLKRAGVPVRDRLFFPRVLFLSPDLDLDPSLRDRPEIVPQPRLQDFLGSFREGYVGWISDAVTPAWISGGLSYSQLGSVRSLLARVGTWDVLELRSGERLRGDVQDCPFIALDRALTETLEFGRSKALSADTLWALLGHTPQVTVRMYKRGARGWLGRTLSATATIPSSSCVVFVVSGDEAASRVPVSAVHSISLSV